MGLNVRGLLNVIFVTGMVALTLSGCQSKFGDKDPTTQNMDGFDVDGNLQASQDLDSQLARIDDSLSKMRDFVRLFAKTQKADGGYSQLDFLLDVNAELKVQPSLPTDGKYVRVATMNLGIKGLSPACQIVDTKLETASPGDLGGSEDGSEGIVYSMRTCHSGGDFLPVAAVTLVSGHSKLQFDGTNIRNILSDLFKPVVGSQLDAAKGLGKGFWSLLGLVTGGTTGCDIGFGDGLNISSVKCTNVIAKLSDHEQVAFDNLDFTPSEDPRLSLNGTIYNVDAGGERTAKGRVSFSLDRDNRPSLNLDKVP